MKLTLVRHTSVEVPSGICYGITDVPLAPTFWSELEQIRKKLDGEMFDAAFSSPLGRCTKLAAEIIPDNHIRIDHRLTELDFGEWEMAEWNHIFESPEGKNWFADYVNSRCPGGESFTDLIKRAELFMNELHQSSYGQLLVFTHAGIIRALMCLLQGKPAEEAFNTPLKYGQIVNFIYDTDTKLETRNSQQFNKEIQ